MPLEVVWNDEILGSHRITAHAIPLDEGEVK